MSTKIAAVAISFILACCISVSAQETKEEQADVAPQELFKKLVGKWEGNCKTWFQPGKLADESEVTGEFVTVLDGPFVRHTYASTIRGKPRHGEELIGYTAQSKSFQASWIDDFHMNYAIMLSQGEPTTQGFKVLGDYEVGENQPRWSWRTEYELIDDDHLTITAYNISPNGMEAKALETKYVRVNSR